MGGPGAGDRPSDGDMAEVRTRAALQLLLGPPHHERQEGGSPGAHPLHVQGGPLQVVRVPEAAGPVGLRGRPEQGEGSGVEGRGAPVLPQSLHVQGLQKGGELVHRLLAEREGE